MVVDYADRLHPRIDDRRTNKLESSPLQFLRYTLGKRAMGDPLATVAYQRLAVRKRPAKITERFALPLHLTIDLRATNGRLDFRLGSHNAWIGHQPQNVLLRVTGNFCRFEFRE